MNPYQDLPPEGYWRTGVQIPAHEGHGFPNLWRSKFPIDSSTKIITVGSCFAQHISKWIKGNGFSWVDSEPGDAALSLKEREENGYGVFSFRTGNIYTPALLKQWVFQALQLEKEVDEVFEHEKHYFDAFRPLIPVTGFTDPADILAARQVTLACIREALQESDLFIFTLGLTEGWKNKQGYVYPLCPGTVKGEFKSAEHRFVNYSYQQILDDLNSTMDAIVKVNPRMRFLLTVSPVPLTATAEKQHILAATTYSKSVLRAAAGFLAQTRQDVDYFPSYELIAQFPTHGKFYESNLRSVKKEGVDFVMAHFERGIGIDKNSIPAIDFKQDQKALAKKIAKSVDEYCEDILLEEWNQSANDVANDNTINVFLVGDSHLDATAGALTQCGVANRGGMIMRSHTWAGSGFAFDDEEYFVPLDGSMARKKWLQTVSVLNHSNAATKYLITNIGLHTNVNVPRLYKWAEENQLSTVNPEDVVTFFRLINQNNLKLMQSFIARGIQCIVVSDPPTQSINAGFAPLIAWVALYEPVALQVYQELGCAVVNVRDAYPEGIPAAFYSQQMLGDVRDWVHGSPDYYFALGQLLSQKISQLSAAKA
jgi:hypothetical protein